MRAAQHPTLPQTPTSPLPCPSGRIMSPREAPSQSEIRPRMGDLFVLPMNQPVNCEGRRVTRRPSVVWVVRLDGQLADHPLRPVVLAEELHEARLREGDLHGAFLARLDIHAV